MSQHVTINEKKFYRSAELAQHFGYSLDYISRLAREGKVDATRIGRQWFVEVLSLKKFIDEVNKQKEVSREQLRKTRKQELAKNSSNVTNFSSFSKTKNDRYHLVKELYRKPISENNPDNIFDILKAATGSALVLIAGLLSAAVINPNDFYTFYSNLDFRNITHEFVLQKRTEVVAGALGSWFDQNEEQPIDMSENKSISSAGLVIFDEQATADEIERIRNSFSDEVEIEFNNEDSGVITPVFKNNNGEEYHFLMVPIDGAS